MAQTILITGANRGIGFALTRELLSVGEFVVACTRRPDSAELRDLGGKFGGMLEIAGLDITSDQSVSDLAAWLPEKIGALDVLVNNAAIFPEEGNESITGIALQHFRDAFETNVIGAVRVTRALLPLLEKAKQPRVVNISSGAGSIAGKDDSAYYAYSTSKAALNMVTRAMAAELQPKNVCVVAMTPGWVRTEMGGSNAPLSPEESAHAIARTILSLTMEETSKFIDRTGAEVTYGW